MVMEGAETREQFMARWGMTMHPSPIVERIDRLEKAVIELQALLTRFNMAELKNRL